MSRNKESDRELELEDDIAFHRADWRFERIGWCVMALILLAAAAGLTGHGLFSRRIAGEASAPLRIEYAAIGRYQAPAELSLYLAPSIGDSDRVRVELSRAFVESVEIERIDPEPESVEARPDRYAFEFLRSPTAEALITIHYRAEKFGTLPLGVAVPGDAELDVRPFFLP